MRILRIILIVILAICIGFAGGYFWQVQKVRDLEAKMKSVMVETETSLQASRNQLARAEGQREIYKVKALIAEARCHVMERNFGRAEETIVAIESSLDKALSPLGEKGMEVRDHMKMDLEEIKEGIKKLDIKVKVRIEELGKSLAPMLEK